MDPSLLLVAEWKLNTNDSGMFAELACSYQTLHGHVDILSYVWNDS